MARTKWILISVLAVALLAAGTFVFYALRTPDAPSGELTAMPVQTQEQLPDVPAGTLVFELSQEESEARFIIDEVLNGSPKTVVGASRDVAAQILVDPDDLSSVQVGVIQVNARTLVTDNGRRNNTIRNIILQTNQYEFVTFTPTQISGLPVRAAAGETLSFQMAGDLTVRDVTRPVTFEVTVTAESESRLVGLATATISRADFGLQIPAVPNVAFVAEEFQLQLEFVALALGS